MGDGWKKNDPHYRHTPIVLGCAIHVHSVRIHALRRLYGSYAHHLVAQEDQRRVYNAQYGQPSSLQA